ncbi:hypothetical protein [Prosthecomicrobium sp. N25]|uniref:hypothetical protein n=1 Tax=Prosthecomicrobium sp. N25 TaxID=3129254 RepID=UPI00307880CC
MTKEALSAVPGQARFEQMIRQLSRIELVSIASLIVLAAVIVLYSTFVGIWSSSTAFFFATMGLSAGVSAAWLTIGGFLGFLFGVPRLVQRAPSEPETESASYRTALLNSNSNLEQISDWLTKIFVGLGLVNLQRLPDALERYSRIFDDAQMLRSGMALAASQYYVSITAVALGIGFMIVYIETRTRITALLMVQEGYNKEATVSDEQFQQAASAPQFLAAEGNGDIRPVLSISTIRNQPIPADKAVLSASASEIDTLKKRVARAAAFARSGNYMAAESEWLQVIADPEGSKELDYYLRLAEVRSAQGRPRDALSTLIQARTKFGDDYEILRRSIFTALYIQQPDSFDQALKAAAAITSQSGHVVDAMVYVWIAAAYGQKADWLKKNNADQTLVEECRLGVINAVQKVRELTPEKHRNPRIRLRQMLYPGSENGSISENDLAVFQKDPVIEDLIMN